MVLGVIAEIPWWNLDAEQGGAALVSAALLMTAMVAASCATAVGAGKALLPVGAVLGFMAVDEYFVLHEQVEAALGVDWQLLYLPAFATAAVAALLAAHRHRDDRPFLSYWFAGAAAWGISQVLEKVQWDGGTPRAGYSKLMVTEELLEMIGSACFVMAATVLIYRRFGSPERAGA